MKMWEIHCTVRSVDTHHYTPRACARGKVIGRIVIVVVVVVVIVVDTKIAKSGDLGT